MADNLVSFVLIFLCVFLEGLFSGGELALVASDVNKIRQRAESGSKSAALALKLLQKPEWFLSATLSGTNVCVVASTSIATALSISILGATQGPPVAVMVMIPLLLVVGEIVPKTVFLQHAEFVAMKLSWFIWAASWVLFPVVFLISRISRGTVRLSAGEKDFISSPFITKDGLKYLLRQGGAKSDILSAEKDMVRNIIDFSDVKVSEIMVPLSNMTTLPVTASLGEAAVVASEKRYIRIPVYCDQIFNIIGILDYFDLLEALRGQTAESFTLSKDRTVESCLRPVVFYVPETKLVKELLIELQLRSERMAVVVDEYGGAVGIVTIEDILEEIVGEIDDEYDTGEKLYKEIGPGKYLFNAKISLERFTQIIPLEIPEGEYETLGGFLLYKMKRIPRRKETVKHENILFVIEDADLKSIREVLVELQSVDVEGAAGGGNK